MKKHRAITLRREEDGTPLSWRECGCRLKEDHDCTRKRKQISIGTGSPNLFLLDHWGLMLEYAFGEIAYHVGSSLYGKKWRDIDVRMIMDDEKFDALFGPPNNGTRHHTRSIGFYSVLMTAISVWGQKVTGLPIDFQIQRRSDVKQSDWDKSRNPLGTFVGKPKPPWQRDRKTGDESAKTE